MSKMTHYVASGVIIIVAFYFLAYMPWVNQQMETKSRIDQARQELDDFHATIQQFPSIMASRDELVGLQDKLQSRLYAKDDIISLFDHLTEDAQKLSLKVVEISPTVEELLLLNSISPSSDRPEFLNISIDLEGDFQDLGGYLQEIENNGFFRGLNRCQVQASYDPARKTLMRLQFKALLRGMEDA